MIQQYDPSGIFEQVNKGGVCDVKTVVISLTAATANQLCVTAVTSKKIVVLSGLINSQGIQTYISFRTASGGTIIGYYSVPANTVASPNVIIEPHVWGAFATASGQGLYADNSAAVIATVTLRYIEVVA